MKRRMTPAIAKAIAVAYHAYQSADTDNATAVWGRMLLEDVAPFPTLDLIDVELTRRIVANAERRIAAQKEAA